MRSMKQLATIFDRGSIVLLTMALSSGLLLGGGVSATARTTFLVLAGAAFVAMLFAMVFEGRWRIVSSAIWLLPTVVFAVAAIQLRLLPLDRIGIAFGPFVP